MVYEMERKYRVPHRQGVIAAKQAEDIFCDGSADNASLDLQNQISSNPPSIAAMVTRHRLGF